MIKEALYVLVIQSKGIFLAFSSYMLEKYCKKIRQLNQLKVEHKTIKNSLNVHKGGYQASKWGKRLSEMREETIEEKINRCDM